MKTISADLVLEKNLLYSDQPWIVLFELEVDSDSTLRLAAYPEDVTWNGSRWTRFPVYIDVMSEESGGRLEGIAVHVSNVDRMVSAYAENADLLGNDVTLYIVHKGHMDDTDVLSFTYRINSIDVTADVATFNLGHEDLYNLQVPHRRYVRDKCSWIYKDDKCNYPNDDFGPISNKNFIPGGDGDKEGGWFVVNTNAGDSDECNISGGTLNLKAGTGGSYLWTNLSQAGVYVYKPLSSDFDINTKYLSSPSQYSGGGFVVMDSTTSLQWLSIISRLEGDTARMVVQRCYGTVYDVANKPLLPYWRIARSGATFTFYAHAESTTTWTELATIVAGEQPNTVRVGFMTYTKSSAAGVVHSWDYFHADSGGMSTCDYTLDGSNGCRAHGNTLNFGGCPSLPYGRLYGI